MIYLLDLNYTLVSNSAGKYPFTKEIIEAERYRQWLVDTLRNETVVLITVRDRKFEKFTLEQIEKYTGWQPTDTYFAPHFEYGGAPTTKLKGLKTYIFPKYGDDPKSYMAIESNPKTQVMYNRIGIKALNQSQFRRTINDNKEIKLL